jgi:myo-inositol-1(or 4)-monophosphatase
MPIYGFIYEYSRDSLIEGGPGLGLKDGDASLPTMSQRKLDDNSIVGLAFPLKEPYLRQLEPIMDELHIRSMGSGALTLTYVALGFLDGCVDFRSKSWDVAAALALLGAAGGRARFFGNQLFPLKTFDIRQKPGPFYAGTEDFCALCEKLLFPAE